MSKNHLWIRWAMFTILAVVIVSLAVAQRRTAPRARPRPRPLTALQRQLFIYCPNTITQSFPTSGPAQTTWTICWNEVAGTDSLNDPNGLVIGPVYFQKSPTAPMVRILWDMRVSDYFVPYHPPGSPRYYDLSDFNFVLTSVSSADCPASVGGTTISPHVCEEIHDRGLMWKDYSG